MRLTIVDLSALSVYGGGKRWWRLRLTRRRVAQISDGRPTDLLVSRRVPRSHARGVPAKCCSSDSGSTPDDKIASAHTYTRHHTITSRVTSRHLRLDFLFLPPSLEQDHPPAQPPAPDFFSPIPSSSQPAPAPRPCLLLSPYQFGSPVSTTPHGRCVCGRRSRACGRRGSSAR